MSIHRLGQAFLRAGIWRPAAALMRNLPFTGKMAVIGVAFMLPLLWLLVTFVNTQRDALGFVEKERDGVLYAQALYSAMDKAIAWRLEARNVVFGEAGANADAARQAFDVELKRLEQVQAELIPTLGAQASWVRVKQSVAAVQDPRQSSPDAVYAQMTAVTQSMTDLLAEVTDTSGLALDPDMGSYYLMSAVLMRAPRVISGTGELRGLAGGALKAGQISAPALARMTQLRAVVAYERDLAIQDLSNARNADPVLTRNMEESAATATAEFLKKLEDTFPMGVTAVQGERAGFLAMVNPTLAAQFKQAQTHLRVLDQMLAQRRNQLTSDLWLALGLTFVGLLLAFYLTMGFYWALANGLQTVRAELVTMSMGDMRDDIAVVGHDELTGLLRELSYMQAGLRDTMRQVRHSSNEVVNSAIEIATGTHDLSVRTESAAAALEESSAALEQTTATTGHTVEAVHKATELAQSNAEVAARGGQVVAEVVATMERIQSSSGKISDIIGVIDGIAFQTNILALNAAVEAARAGESGRGFAVVASEVRNLAQRSAAAAKEIKTLITSSVEQVAQGTRVVRGAGEAMREIVQTADQVRSLMDEVITAAREQNQGIAQIGLAVQELDQNTQANAALVEEAAAAATSQRDSALRMAAMVDEFRLAPGKSTQLSKIEGLDVDTIIDGHRQWKVKLRQAIEDQATIDVATLSRDDCCGLGKWVYAEGGQRFGHAANFTALIERHKTFHRVAGQVGELVNQKRYLEAETSMAPGTPFANATREVVQVLSAAKRMGF